ncbi:MAG: hypothetical protein ACI9H6_000819 [Patiriisocius sp.]|jgi:hypothetical protein
MSTMQNPKAEPIEESPVDFSQVKVRLLDLSFVDELQFHQPLLNEKVRVLSPDEIHNHADHFSDWPGYVVAKGRMVSHLAGKVAEADIKHVQDNWDAFIWIPGDSAELIEE